MCSQRSQWTVSRMVRRRLLRGGDLQEVLERTGRLPERDLRIVAYEVLRGVQGMMTSALLHHGDIKPANVGLLRPGDFKSARIFGFGSSLPLGALLFTPIYLNILSSTSLAARLGDDTTGASRQSKSCIMW